MWPPDRRGRGGLPLGTIEGAGGQLEAELALDALVVLLLDEELSDELDPPLSDEPEPALSDEPDAPAGTVEEDPERESVR